VTVGEYFKKANSLEDCGQDVESEQFDILVQNYLTHSVEYHGELSKSLGMVQALKAYDPEAYPDVDEYGDNHREDEEDKPKEEDSNDKKILGMTLLVGGLPVQFMGLAWWVSRGVVIRDMRADLAGQINYQKWTHKLSKSRSVAIKMLELEAEAAKTNGTTFTKQQELEDLKSKNIKNITSGKYFNPEEYKLGKLNTEGELKFRQALEAELKHFEKKERFEGRIGKMMFLSGVALSITGAVLLAAADSACPKKELQKELLMTLDEIAVRIRESHKKLDTNTENFLKLIKE
jgi:hypothetical protein